MAVGIAGHVGEHVADRPAGQRRGCRRLEVAQRFDNGQEPRLGVGDQAEVAARDAGRLAHRVHARRAAPDPRDGRGPPTMDHRCQPPGTRTPPTGPSAAWPATCGGCSSPTTRATYFAPESRRAFGAAGLRGFWMGYFAGRSAPMGPVGPAVVAATFFNFAPAMVARSIPDAWSFATPASILDARRAIDEALGRLLGPTLADPSLARAARPGGARVGEADGAGRPLFAANAALPTPAGPPCPVVGRHLPARAPRRRPRRRGDGGRPRRVRGPRDVGGDRRPHPGGPPAQPGVDRPRVGRRGRAAALAGLGPTPRGAHRLGAAGPGPARSGHRPPGRGALAAGRPGAAEELAGLLKPVAGALLAAGEIPMPNPMGLPRF